MAKPRHKYSDEELAFIKDNLKGRYRTELLEMFNEHFGTDLSMAQLNGVIGRYGFKSGMNTQFRKGQTSWNKGKPMPPEMYRKLKPTMFQKGHVVWHTRELGDEKLGKDNYIMVKVRDDPYAATSNWKQMNQIVWEQSHHQKLPEGSVVIFKDGNIRNLRPWNLMAVTRQQLLCMNRKGLIYDEAELTEAGAEVARLLQTAYERQKGEHDEACKEDDGINEGTRRE